VPRLLANDLKDDRILNAIFTLALARHACPTLTPVGFIGPSQLRVVFTHPSEATADRAMAVDHAAAIACLC
jgi:hypothetical protein